MARNGSGVYTPPAASYPAVSGTLIESAKFNAVIDDVATALTESMTISGQTAMTGDLPMGTHKVTGVGNGVAATDACTYGQAQSLSDVAANTVAAATVTPADADVMPVMVSSVLKKVTWTNIKATLKTYFDTLYMALVAPGTAGNVLTSNGAAWTSNAPATTAFSSSAENIAGAVENKAVDPLGIREAFNASGAAPVYACRAWVNFNGTGTVAIRASGNVSSITDNGVGDYTINFTTAMPDADYVFSASQGKLPQAVCIKETDGGGRTAASLRVLSAGISSGVMSTYDVEQANISIFR